LFGDTLLIFTELLKSKKIYHSLFVLLKVVLCLSLPDDFKH